MPLVDIWKLVGASLIAEHKKCHVYQMGTMNINSNLNVNLTFFHKESKHVKLVTMMPSLIQLYVY